MTDSVFNNLELFLAHALQLEMEATQRLYDAASMMEAHNSPVLHELFLQLGRAGLQHAKEIKQLCHDQALPELAPGEYQWATANAPESMGIEQLHHMLNPRQALEFVLDCERHAYDYYADISAKTSDPQIREYANQFAAEENEHINWVHQKMKKHLEPSVDCAGDLGHGEQDTPALPE